VARPERPTLRGRIAPRSGTAACLRRRDLVSKAQLADCVEGRRD
jgi:hypothetical protein